MNQIAFSLFGRAIHWYGIMIALGFVSAVSLLLAKRKHVPMSREHVFDVSMIAMFLGLIGARVFYIVEFWQQDFAGRGILELFRVDHGGLVFYGGFLAAFAGVCVYAWRKQLSLPRLLDIFAPAMALAHAFGRIGCFLQGCCFGKPAHGWGVVFPIYSAPACRYSDPLTGCSLPLIPVQLYESALNFLLCGILLLLFRFCKKGGQIAAVYLMCYAVLRFSLEFMRGDHVDSIAGATPSQFIALAVTFPLGLILFLYWTLKKSSVNPVTEAAHDNAR